MDPSILIFDTPWEAAAACGVRILEILNQVRKDRGGATFAVSGGSTPKLMFEAMAKRPFQWQGIELFQVDERCVPPDNIESNFRMIRQSLLNNSSIDEKQFHRVKAELEPAEAVREYIDEIRKVFQLNRDAPPVFDVIQRGMGPDAHTASLFPGEPLIENRTGIAAVVYVEKFKQHRVTLLRAVLEQARHTLCLATGEEKAEALSRVLNTPFNPLRLPSQISSANTVWFIDKAAASRL